MVFWRYELINLEESEWDKFTQPKRFTLIGMVDEAYEHAYQPMQWRRYSSPCMFN